MVLHPSAFICGFEHQSHLFSPSLKLEHKTCGPGCFYKGKNHHIKEQLPKTWSYKLTLGQIRLIRSSERVKNPTFLKCVWEKRAVWILIEYSPTELFVHFFSKYKTVLFTVSKHHYKSPVFIVIGHNWCSIFMLNLVTILGERKANYYHYLIYRNG